MDLGLVAISLTLLCVAALYASVGHGGASGYLAILSLTTYGAMESGWLKQHAWCLNLVVAAIAFWHFHRAGHHVPKLTVPFIVASVPFAMLGGYLLVDGVIYDLLLSICLLIAAWRLVTIRVDIVEIDGVPEWKIVTPVGGTIGLASGIVGVGGGVFLSPILLLKKWATPKGAAATAALFVWVNSLAGLVGAALSDQLDLELGVLAPFAFAVLVGGFIGSRYGAGVAPQQMVRRLLIIVLIVAAARRVVELF
ncbi:MAG: sulfite exporter TauE/SafE family protein [Candidatus Thalassarchaeaceae archaeon]|nr:sulfite exporter TauE/SafE family protein [Candidatus Thalassarchaeaceae archaeon]